MLNIDHEAVTWIQIKEIWHESDDRESNEEQQPSYKKLKGSLNPDEFRHLMIHNDDEGQQFIFGWKELVKVTHVPLYIFAQDPRNQHFYSNHIDSNGNKPYS